MKVLLIQNLVYTPVRGGANKANRVLLEGLAARGHSCRVVAPATGRQGLQTATEFLNELAHRRIAYVDSSGSTVFECDKVRVYALKNPSQLHAYAVQEIQRFQPTVTLVSSSSHLELVLEQRGTRVVYLAHSPWELPFGLGHALDNPALADQIRRTHGIIAVSQDLQKRIREGCGREAVVLHFPVYGSGPFPSLGRFGRGFVTMVNPCAYKGISVFAELARRMAHLRFAAVPSWGTTAADLRLLQQLPNVTILSSCDDIRQILKRTQVLLMPSLWPEGFGLVAVEAMVHGIPVIAGDWAGLPEAKLGTDYVLPVRPIERYEPGWDEKGLRVPIVPEQDIEPWVEALASLTADKDRYGELSRASREAAWHFVAGLSVDPFEDYLETVARLPEMPAPSAARSRTADFAKNGLRADVHRLSASRRALLAARLARQTRTATRPSIPSLPRGPGSNHFPLSFAQQRLWFVEQLEPAGARYRLPHVIRLRGRLDVRALEWSIHEVVRRHEALRTSFPISGEGPVQQVAPTLTVTLDLVELRGGAGAEQETEIQRCVDEEAQQLFPLASGPLIRTKLLRLAEQEHVLLLSIHHLVCDGWSLGILFREIESLYRARVRQEPPRLPGLPIQYADFAVWQRQYLTGRPLETQLAYWKRQLGPDVPALELPADRPRPPVQTYAGAAHQIELSTVLTRDLHTLREREGVTLFMVLLAAFKVLLHRYSGQEDIVVGSPIANRNYQEIEALIGFFVNTLVLRTDLSGNPTFRELLHRVRDVALGAYTHQELPFEKLVEELRPERDLSRVPLFQVFFNMLSYDDERLALDGLTAEFLDFPKKEAAFDLSLYARPREERIALNLVYNTDLFRRQRMVEMMAQLELLLQQIVRQPEGRIQEYSLVTDGARLILPDPTCGLREETKETAQHGFENSVRQFPRSVAATDPLQSVSYAELHSCSNRLAHTLRSHGVRPGEVVAIYAERGVALVAAVLGVLKSGAVFTILDPAFPAARLTAQLHSSRPRGWVSVTSASPSLRDATAPIACRLEVPRRLGEWTEALADGSADEPGTGVSPDDPAYVVFTSGTTGASPKAILGTHKPLAHFLRWHSRTFGLTASDHFSMLSGLSHDPLLRDVFTPLSLGATLHIPEPEDLKNPWRLVDWMCQQGITVAHMTPTLAEVLATEPGDGRPPELSSLRYVFLGGDVLTAALVTKLKKRAPYATCVNFYGTTETPQAVSCHVVPDPTDPAGQEETSPPARLIPIGRGIDDVQLLVLNPVGRQAGIGELGEICVRTPYLSQGYMNDAELTARRFVANPFAAGLHDRMYRTGDLGRYDPQGDVEFRGRLDRQVKIRGFRIEPAEIEAALTSHAAVRDAVVTVVESDAAGGRLVAYLVCAADVPTLPLRGYLRRRLPDYMIPTQFIKVPTLPLTANGKIDYRRLPRVSDPRDGRDFVPPATAAEQQLAGIWAQVLGVEKVGRGDNFFDLGGHSLMVIQAVAQIERTMGVRMPLREFFGQTLRQFAASCEQAMDIRVGVPVDHLV
jgi:amino acid adenylation domain-containing protein